MTDGHCWDRKTAALIQLFGLLAADSTVVFGFIRESTTNHGLYSLTHTPSCSLFTQLPDTAIQSPPPRSLSPTSLLLCFIYEAVPQTHYSLIR